MSIDVEANTIDNKTQTMTTEKLNNVALFTLFDDTSSKLLQLVSSFTEEAMEERRVAGSWTPAQICEHIIKSNNSIAHALSAKTEITEREPDLRVPEVKELFLDFTKKFQSPPFVIPTRVDYKKEMIIEDLQKSIKEFRELANTVNLYETGDIPGFGVLTKLELVYFNVYHTQRHIKQLENLHNGKQGRQVI